MPLSNVILISMHKFTNRMREHTHTHTQPFNGPLSRTTRVSQYQKGKTNLDFTKQETVSGSGITWAVCKSAPCSRQITMPAPHHSFYRPDACPSCRPTNSVIALKAQSIKSIPVHYYDCRCNTNDTSLKANNRERKCADTIGTVPGWQFPMLTTTI